MKMLILIKISKECVPSGLFNNMQCTSIGSDNGLAPTSRQSISWTYDGKFTDTWHASFGLNEFIDCFHCTVMLHVCVDQFTEHLINLF